MFCIEDRFFTKTYRTSNVYCDAGNNRIAAEHAVVFNKRVVIMLLYFENVTRGRDARDSKDFDFQVEETFSPALILVGILDSPVINVGASFKYPYSSEGLHR